MSEGELPKETSVPDLNSTKEFIKAKNFDDSINPSVSRVNIIDSLPAPAQLRRTRRVSSSIDDPRIKK